MSGINQSLEVFDRAVGRFDAEEVGRVVAPASIARKFLDWHQLDGIDTEVREIVETRNNRIKCSFRSKVSDVEFIDHKLVERLDPKATVTPLVWLCANFDDCVWLWY